MTKAYSDPITPVQQPLARKISSDGESAKCACFLRWEGIMETQFRPLEVLCANNWGLLALRVVVGDYVCNNQGCGDDRQTDR